MRKLITLIALWIGLIYYSYAGTRVETENVIFQGSVDAQLFEGDFIDIAAPSWVTNPPASGHVRMFGQTVQGQEALYYMQSDGTYYRIARDSVVTIYNDETNALNRGEAVYITTGITGTVHKVKRAMANSASTMPAFGIVTEANGIASSNTGTIMFFGRTVTNIDTSAYNTSGISLYVSPTVAGGLTTNEPSYPDYSQLVGFVNKFGTSGAISTRLYKPTRVNRPAFVASILYTNTYAAATTNIVICSNLVSYVGYGNTEYNTTTGEWTPPQGSCEMGGSFRCRTAISQNRYVKMYLFKNGELFSEF